MLSNGNIEEPTFVVAFQKQLEAAKTAVTGVQKQLEAAKTAVTEAPKGDQSSQFDFTGQFEKIEKELGTIREALRRSAHCERNVRTKLESSTRDANDISDYCVDFKTKLEEIKTKLENIGSNIESTKIKVKELFPQPSQSQPCSSGAKDDGEEVIGHENGKTKSKEWEKYEADLDREILNSSAMTHLKVSYDHLETQLKLCLLCLSVFPEDYEIKKRVLIYWWIGEGLVAPKGEKPAEDVGEECFAKLLGYGLIQPIHAKASKIVHRCKIHPWIRRMLVWTAKEAGFFDLDERGRPSTDFIRSRRACLVKGSSLRVDSNTNQNALLSLINVDENIVRLRREWLSELGKVVVLQLGRWQTQAKHHIEVEDVSLLNGLGSLQHLRYLSLRGISRITELPDSIGKLGNLRILDLRACHNLEKLPAGITSLKRLTHLDATECYLLDRMPKGLGSLSELQVLKGFVWGSSQSSRLGELTKLEKLRKLSMSIGNDTMISAELKELAKLKSLRSLTIVWSGEVGKTKPRTIFKVPSRIPSAEPATITIPTIQKLDLRCFPKDDTPGWLRGFTNLTSLYIRGGKLRNLTLEHLNKLEILRLKFLKNLDSDWLVLEGKLPQLKSAEIHDCPSLKSPPKLDGDGVWFKENIVQEISPSIEIQRVVEILPPIEE